MTINFNALSVSEATKLGEYAGDKKLILETNRAFYDGEHWQAGLGYIGPWVAERPGLTAQQRDVIHRYQTALRREFTSVNAIKEGVDRDVMGVAGIEPRWGFAPIAIELPENATPESPAAKAAQEKADAKAQHAADLLTPWWDTNSGHAIIQDAATHLLYGANPIAEVSVRLYVPRAMLESSTVEGKTVRTLTVTSIDDALTKIRCEVIDPDIGRVVEDPDTLAAIGLKFGKRNDQQIVEATYLDGDQTVVATIASDTRQSIKLDMRRRLTMRTVKRVGLITEQIRQSQRALNFAASMLKRNVETGGFIQDTITNADLPGREVGEGDAKRFVLDPIERGPLAINSFRGYPIYDKDGNVTQYTTPDIDHREPVDPTPTIKAKQEHYADILGGFNQKHVLISGDATASGESRIQARADHIAELRRTQAPVEQLGRWLIETLLLFADALVAANGGTAERPLDGLRATFSCYLDAGPIDSSERAQNVAEMEAGALSKTTTIERNGTVDVDAELARITSEPTAGLDAEVKRAEIYAAWVKGGVGEAFAAKRAGLTPAEIQELTTAQTDQPPAVTQ